MVNLKNLFTLSALLSGLLGLGLFLFPEQLIAQRTGSAPDVLAAHIASQFGTALLAIAVISWFARRADDSAGRNALIIGLVFIYIMLPIETAISILRGSESAAGWVLVILFGLLALGFYLLGKPRLRP